MWFVSVAHPDFELRRGAGSILVALSAFLFFQLFLLFSPKISFVNFYPLDNDLSGG